MKGRFPANLLVSGDVLNDGKIYKSGDVKPYEWADNNIYDHGVAKKGNKCTSNHKGDTGSYSRYFDLDKWYKSTHDDNPSDREKLFSYLITMGSREGENVLRLS
jgi:hypothetical protein